MQLSGVPMIDARDPRTEPPVDAIEEPGGLVISYGDAREPVSVEFLRASARGFWKPGQKSIPLEPVSFRKS